MLNGIWGFFVIGGILTGAFLGRMDLVTQAVIGGGKSAMELAFTMAGVVAVWSGVLTIAEKGGMIDALAEKMTPLMDFLFPSVLPLTREFLIFSVCLSLHIHHEPDLALSCLGCLSVTHAADFPVSSLWSLTLYSAQSLHSDDES